MAGMIPFDPSTGSKMIASVGGDINSRIARLGMSPRQIELNRRWARYRCAQYDTCRVDWAGREIPSSGDEVIASGAQIAPGFYDASGSTMPLKFRKPSAPYQLGRVIVNRFTGMLFGKKKHPKIRYEGDEDSEDFCTSIAEVSRLWARMASVRRFGGATGTGVVGFQFVNGLPRIDVHDPRWCDPTFKDREKLVLEAIDKRYQYPVERRNQDTGQWETIPFWYRRSIDEQSDTIYEPTPVMPNGEEPKWKIQTSVDHGLGFCPVVWIQNTPVADDIDGDPDTHGTEDLLHSIDMLLSQADFGTLANLDPTLVISSALALPEIRKGSDNAIKLGPDGKAQYLELQGSGSKSAVELADKFRSCVLEVTQCVLDQPDQAAPATATEIERRYSAMLERVEDFQEQYGEHGVKPLLEMMMTAARKLNSPVLVEGRPIVQVLNLPKRTIEDPANPGKSILVDRKLGPEGGTLSLQWGRSFTPSPADAVQAVTAATAAEAGGLIDKKHASAYVADIFEVEDVDGMLNDLESAAAKQEEQQAQAAMAGMHGSTPAPTPAKNQIRPTRVPPAPRRPPQEDVQ